MVIMKNKDSSTSIIKVLFNKFLRPYFSYVIFIFSLKFLGVLFGLIFPLITKYLIDDVFIGKNTTFMFYIIVGSIILYILSSFASFYDNFLQSKLEGLLYKDIAASLYDNINKTNVGEIENIKTGDLIFRIMDNASMVAGIPTEILPNLFTSGIGLIMPLIIMFSMDSSLTIVLISPILLFAISSYILGSRLENLQNSVFRCSSFLYSLLKENLSIIVLIKVFNLEEWSLQRFKISLNNYYEKSLNLARLSALNLSAGEIFFEAPMILLLFFGGTSVIDGSMTIGTFTAFMSYISLFFSPISQLSALWGEYKMQIPAFHRINEILNLKQDNILSKRLNIIDGEINCINLYFAYENDNYIINNLNHTFTRGLNYILGDNGSGKSTLLKLICAIYSPNKGNIMIDNNNIENINTKDLRDNITLIFPDPYLFDGSIYDNIKIGKLSASKEEIISAAKKIGIHNFIMDLPANYDTNIGEEGFKLSSGEKQKISFARAILKDSPILLLDEVTKSIDADSRESIDKFVYSLKEEKTVLIITHHVEDILPNSNIIEL